MLVLFEGDLGTRDTLRFIEEKLGAGIWSWNLTTNSMEWSRGLFALLGLEPGVTQPSLFAIKQAMHPDDRQIHNDLEQTLRDSVAVEQEFRILTATGRVRWILNRAEPVVDSRSNAKKAVGVFFDVTKIHEAFHLFKNRDDRYRALINMVDAIVFTANQDGKVTDLPNWQRMRMEKSENLFQGDWWAAITERADLAATNDAWARSVGSGSPLDITHKLMRPDGSFGAFRTQAIPIKNLTGDVQEWIGLSAETLVPEKTSSEVERSFILTGAQIRAGRAILGLSVQDLAGLSQISPSTVRRLEEVSGAVAVKEEAHAKLQTALEKAGVEFLFASGKKPGVRPR